MSDFRINEQNRQFELDVEGQKAIITYSKKEGAIALNHTEVPESLQGKGIANKIVSQALNYIKENGFKVIPNCSFVAAYIQRHPEWKSLVK